MNMNAHVCAWLEAQLDRAERQIRAHQSPDMIHGWRQEEKRLLLSWHRERYAPPPVNYEIKEYPRCVPVTRSL